ncbi:MAG: protein-methionine-sulfoxide reductase heme-binding subunit MsrQ [Gammaproteobacteria bacterium]|nr:protein-methionine-sulfoxide reductase heme-binding subunit MsrQ [Gammaproteobacteria bacterium]MDH5485905.1 protein-methionine-sulfoxide reductase heme-binding subunit MsrQ [Gammaproteobacteria bacterium]
MIKPAIFVVALVPLAWIIYRTVNNDLGANPIETLNRYTGDWVLRFLMITLAVTPLRKLTGWNGLLRYRRMLGLFAFFYVCLHFLSYAWLDQNFVLADIIKDVIKRPYITVGFASFLMLIPLAVTSTNAMVRRLGAKRWQTLHRLVYAIGIGGVVHFLWLVKSDIREPLVYAIILTLLLGYRFWTRVHSSQNTVASGTVP